MCTKSAYSQYLTLEATTNNLSKTFQRTFEPTTVSRTTTASSGPFFRIVTYTLFYVSFANEFSGSVAFFPDYFLFRYSLSAAFLGYVHARLRGAFISYLSFIFFFFVIRLTFHFLHTCILSIRNTRGYCAQCAYAVDRLNFLSSSAVKIYERESKIVARHYRLQLRATGNRGENEVRNTTITIRKTFFASHFLSRLGNERRKFREKISPAIANERISSHRSLCFRQSRSYNLQFCIINAATRPYLLPACVSLSPKRIITIIVCTILHTRRGIPSVERKIIVRVDKKMSERGGGGNVARIAIRIPPKLCLDTQLGRFEINDAITVATADDMNLCSRVK